jgi:ABC-2 type transport system ATP-binding protein
MTTTNVVTISGLRHRYGRTTALDGVDLTIAPGECVTLLGPNGAGKTTLVSALTGVLTPSEGHVAISGGDPRDARTRQRLGVVHQIAGFPRTLKVGELVSGWAVRAGRPASAAGPVLTEVGLADLADRRVTKLSGGQQQRLQFAMALVVDPTLLVLDEPTVGLDIEARRHFWDTLAARRDRGAAVLLTTHQIEEAAAVADRVVLLDRGRVIASDHPVALTSRLADRTVTARTGLLHDDLHALPAVADLTMLEPGLVRLVTTSPEATVRTLLAADPAVTDLLVEGASLEQAIVSLTATGTQEVPA